MPWYKKYLENIWNVPNVLTMMRLALIPVYVFLFCRGRFLAAMCVFIVASLTDWLDGYLARKYDQITAFGKLMDPLADKVMVLTVMLTQVIHGNVSLLVLCVVAVKELVMVLGGWILVRFFDVVVYASPIGKIAQFTFCVGLALTFLHDKFLSWPVQLDQAVIWIAVGLTLVALFHYAAGIIAKLKEGKAD